MYPVQDTTMNKRFLTNEHFTVKKKKTKPDTKLIFLCSVKLSFFNHLLKTKEVIALEIMEISQILNLQLSNLTAFLL